MLTISNQQSVILPVFNLKLPQSDGVYNTSELQKLRDELQAFLELIDQQIQTAVPKNSF